MTVDEVIERLLEISEKCNRLAVNRSRITGKLDEENGPGQMSKSYLNTACQIDQMWSAGDRKNARRIALGCGLSID